MGKRNRGGGGSSSRHTSASNGAANGIGNASAAAPRPAAALNPQAQRAANLGSTLIHIGIVWLIVGGLGALIGNEAGDGAALGANSSNGTAGAGVDSGNGGEANVAAAGASAASASPAEPSGGGSIVVDGCSVPKETLGAMGSYPDPFGITDEMRRGFHPVVKFPEVWVDSVPPAGSAVSGDALTSTEAPAQADHATKQRWHPPWDRKGRVKILDYVVIDFRTTAGASQLVDPGRAEDVARERRRSGFRGEYGVGRYDEDRSHLYSSEMFQDESRDVDGYQGARTVHVGVDLGGPVGTKVYAFSDGVIHSAGYNPEHGDYGHVVVVEHALPPLPLDGERRDSSEGATSDIDTPGGTEEEAKPERKVWALYGHLDAKSVRGKVPGKQVRRGQVLGRIGDVHENGGWYYPHVHFQLSSSAPETHDMPGAVSMADRPRALINYPDPRIVLGALY